FWVSCSALPDGCSCCAWLWRFEERTFDNEKGEIQMTPTVLKIGDVVSWRGAWGMQDAVKAIVIGIEVNCDGKYGDETTSVAWNAVRTRRVIVSLNNGHWAYGEQLDPVEVQ